MSEDKEPKHKDPRIALAIAAFAAVSTVGDAARSYFERQDDVAAATRSERDRVTVDQDIQNKVRSAFKDLHERVDELDAVIEEQDRDLFELRVEVETQDRLLEQMGGVDLEFKELLMLQALEDEAKEENHVVTITADAPKPEEAVEDVAEKIVEKKKKRKKERLRPKLDFAPPEPQYFKQQVQQRLPALPPLPGK
jgi:septal ring factor EnvC (AmiA/AmiB activator)